MGIRADPIYTRSLRLIKDFAMSSQKFNPWWKKVNDYLSFEERQEFKKGVSGYRPNNSQEVLLGMLSSGYVNNKFEKPQSHSGKKS
jgi:hypothetical protein